MNRIKGVIFDWAGTTGDFGCTSNTSLDKKQSFTQKGRLHESCLGI